MKAEHIHKVIKTLQNFNVRFISGKYFDQNNIEIKAIDNYIAQVCINKEYYPKISDIEEIKKFLQITSDEVLWPDLPLVTEAKKLGPITKDMEEIKNAPFELEPKQLLILNIILFHPNEEVMFITTGRAHTGKSTYLNIITQIFGDDKAAIPLSELSGFMVAEAVKKRLIASDELGKGDLDTKILKTMISKQDLDVNPKFGKPFHVKCQSNLFYCCNKAPRIDITDTGILRRIIFYERDKTIENPDTTLNKKKYSHDELLWFIRRALAYEKVYPEWKSYFIEETHKYLMKDNSVYICRQFATYSEYKDACSKKGLKAYSEPNWKEIRELFTEWLSN